MKTLTRTRQKGQAIVMVSLSLVAMCGILGLAVDLGWSYFIRRNGQAFADAAALAATEEALRLGGASATAYCGNGTIVCNTPALAPCPGTITTPASNLDNGCLYARGTGSGSNYYGFVNGANGSRTQTSNFEAGSGRLILSNGAQIDTFYWARSRVSESIPQLFSAVLGNRTALVAARATAAIVGLPLDASIVLLNRLNDLAPVGQGGGTIAGKNMYIQGGQNAFVQVPGGIRLAANKALSGEVGSGGSVTAKYTWTMSSSGTTNWSNTFQKPDSGTRFMDPFGGLGVGGGNAQPPPTTAIQADCPVQSSGSTATIQGSSNPNAPLLLAPGNYYSVDNQGRPNWKTISVTGYVRFTATASTTNSPLFTYTGKTTAACKVGSAGSGSASGNYFIYGGLDLQSGPNVKMEPGRYVLAGVNPPNGANSTNNVLNVTSGQTSLTDINTGDVASSPAIDGGEIFILTRQDYPGLRTQIDSIPNLRNGAFINGGSVPDTSHLDFGSTNIQAGAALQLHGLTPGLSATDPLKPFEQVLFWQDQRNSTISYNNDGTINANPGQSVGCNPNVAGAVDMNNPCTNTLNHTNSVQFSYQGGAGSKVYGVFYQPRGAWMMLGGDVSSSNLNKTMIVSGALQVAGSANINFGPLTNPPIERVVALVD
jgi:hypothetical protein